MGNNQDGIGGNCHRYDVVTKSADGQAADRRSFVVDFGIKFGRDSGYDAVCAAPDSLFDKARGSTLKRPEPTAEALIITHPHEDHLGAIPHALKMGYRLPPIYATPFTAKVLAKKLASMRIKQEDWPEIRAVAPGTTVEVAGAKVDLVPVDHMPDAVGLRIRTPDATVFHSGDFKFDETLRLGTRADPAQWKAMGDAGIDAFVSDSTSVGKGGDRVPEEDICRNLTRLLRAEKGRKVVAGVLGSQMDRMISLMRAARADGRTVVLAGYSVEMNMAALKAAGHDIEKAVGGPVTVLPRKLAEKRNLDPAKILVITTGAFAQDGAGLTRASQDGGTGVLAMGGDTTVVLPQSSIPPVKDVYEKLVRDLEGHGAKVITPERSVEQGTGPIHKSGHADGNDTRQALALLRPKTLLPVHGGPDQIATHARVGAEVGVRSLALPGNGAVVRIDRAGTRVIDQQQPAQVGIKNTSKDWRFPFHQYDRLNHQGEMVAEAAYGLRASKFDGNQPGTGRDAPPARSHPGAARQRRGAARG
jgi:ribonuclease J